MLDPIKQFQERWQRMPETSTTSTTRVREVLVTGARGKTGREVTRLLRRSPETVVRAGSSAAAPERAPDDGVRFDWHDRSTWPAAVDGVDAIYLVRPDLPETPELVADLVGLNRDAQVVLLSEQGAGDLAPDHWARRVEDAVAEARHWTLLRPSWFHQVLTDPRFYRDEIRAERVLRLPSGGGAIAWVDTRDIAAVAVAVMQAREEFHGRALTITGPAALPVAAVAGELARHLGEEVRAEDPPADVAIRGLDPWVTDILADLYQRVREGGFAEVSTVVEDLTGASARSLQAFVADHVEEWR
jgi:uncharacterized protein YbjT (DUF2867 family)